MGRVDAGYRAKVGPPRDLAAARVARTQHGVITIGQLLALGLSRSAIPRRVAAGHLHPIHRGVYAVGHTAIGRHGRWLAAVLACGRGAALSHRDAALLEGLPGTPRARVDVTTPDRGRGARPGIVLHRVRALAPQDVTVREGIPVTTIARTLIDLADVLDDRELKRVFHEAEVLRLLDARAVTEATGRVIGRPGLHRIEALTDTPVAPLRSELERRFLALCHTAGLPTPRSTPPSTLPGAASRSTSTGPRNASSSRPTAPPPTPPAEPSRRTAAATSTSPSPACASCASPGNASPTPPGEVIAALALLSATP